MGTGKYSPLCPHASKPGWDMFTFNCYGETPAAWNVDLVNSGAAYDEKTMFDSYDIEGFDSYGYSAFDIDGNYVGVGNGIDRYGYTDMDYLIDSANGGDLYYDLQGCGGGQVLSSFKRNR
jgi:hypothetical protein